MNSVWQCAKPTQMETVRRNAVEHENACARVATQFSQRWLRSYVRGKLRRDRIYQAAYELLHSSAAPILDVGCGLGLLAFYLRERGCRQPVLGLDVDARKIRYGATIAAGRYRDVDLRFHDVENAIPSFSGNVALFDVLHYLPPATQTALLTHLADCIEPGGILIIRDCPREARPRYWITWLAEKFAQAISWNIDSALHFPSRASIDEVFDLTEFERETRPLWGASPFNNHIFIFRRGPGVSPVGRAGFQPATTR
ncbi:MAG TPA: class I SAM-dependent methyltransferase [Chthoniobacterales bacterium]|nr:class I SAM-dependent methyltransferase [Chthoniobacterales bacterium]